LKTTIWPNHGTSDYQNTRLSGAGGGEPPVFGDCIIVTKIMDIRHISAKIQPKSLKLIH